MSPFFCRLQGLGQGSGNLLGAAVGVRPWLWVSLRRVYELGTPVLKDPVVHRQKVWLLCSPPTLRERSHQLLLHGTSCVGLLVPFDCIFVQENPPNSPNRSEPKLLDHTSFSPFLPPLLCCSSCSLCEQFTWA